MEATTRGNEWCRGGDGHDGERHKRAYNHSDEQCDSGKRTSLVAMSASGRAVRIELEVTTELRVWLASDGGRVLYSASFPGGGLPILSSTPT
jgi:hypothetical protein